MKKRLFKVFSLFTILALMLMTLPMQSARADNTAQSLPFSQNWSDNGLITANDNWSGVPGIIGYLGDDPSTTTAGVDPQTVLVPFATQDVIANQTTPNTLSNGGVAEFHLADSTIALNGSGTADAPHIILYLNTTGQSNIIITYNLRDLDSSIDNATQQVALQYRVGNSGNFTNVPAAFVADATTGPSQATLVTPVSVVLPSAVNNQPDIQIRIITYNAGGNDEWVGIDDINVSVTANPTGTGAASPDTVTAGNATLLTVTVSPGSSPPSTGLAVSCDLSTIGGSSSQPFFDDATNGDVTAGDNVFSFQATVDSGTGPGAKSLPCIITDAQSRTGNATIALTVQVPAADLVINEIDYDQPGTDEAEFVEIRNNDNMNVDLSAYNLQFVNGDSGGSAQYQLFSLPAVSLAPGDYFVLCGDAVNVPNCDLDVTQNSNLIQNGEPDAVALRLDTMIVDTVSYEGSTSGSYTEGSGSGLADTAIGSQSISRCPDGFDSAVNNNDFFLRTASAGAANDCPSTVTVAIHEIQGAGHLSPYATQLASTQGVVTAVGSNGFSVSEFRPGGSATANLTTTELGIPGFSVTVLSSGNPLPTATVIGIGGRVPPTMVINDDGTGNVETSGTFDAATDGIDFYESMEGMLVQVNNPVVVGPTNDFGEVFVLADDGTNPGVGVRTTRGGIIVRPNDFNPERIQFDDALATTPPANVGDHFTGPAVGVLDYNFGNFEILITSPLTTAPGGLARETTADPGAHELSVGTFNVENLDPGDGAAKFDELAGLIVNNLRSPDIIALEEVQDNNGPTNDAVVDATNTYTTLITAIQTAGGPTYDFRQINPVDDQDGGEPGGNIRVGFLFRADRGLSFVDRPGAGSTTATTVVSGPNGPELSASPGRIDPTNSAFNNSRKPLVGEFRYNGHTLFVIANHFNSKGGDDPLFGHFQPPTLFSEVQRNQQAQVVNNFVDSILAVDANAKIIAAGDFNDFEFSAPLATLKGGVLNDLIETLPQGERYSYVFEGNSQSLDHILVSNALFSQPFAYDVVHVNSEFAVQASDHEPQVARLYLPLTVYLHGTGSANNPSTLFLDNTAPTATIEKYKDSASIKFSGGNVWKEVGTWPAAPTLSQGTLIALSNLHAWLGLKNSDDQGTRFDLRVEVYKNAALVASGESYCITGVTRNPNQAKEVVLSFGSFPPTAFNGTTDVLSLKVLTRIGTNGSGAFCGGHSNAVGLRLYFDAVHRPSRFDTTIDP
jgi:predicted extracellular nuclease